LSFSGYWIVEALIEICINRIGGAVNLVFCSSANFGAAEVVLCHVQIKIVLLQFSISILVIAGKMICYSAEFMHNIC